MEKDLKRLRQLLQEGSCCSAVLAELAMASLGEENPRLVQAAAGLCGGVHAGMTCGVLTGGALALSLYDPELAGEEMIPAYAAWFRGMAEEACGGTDCSTILASGKISCPELVENGWQKVKELLEDQGFEPDAFSEE